MNSISCDGMLAYKSSIALTTSAFVCMGKVSVLYQCMFSGLSFQIQLLRTHIKFPYSASI